MREFFWIAVGWICWFVFLFPPLNDSLKAKEINEKINGTYTSTNMLDNLEPKKIYTAKSTKITFNNGKYHVYYDLYSKCERYYTNTGVCADNKEKFLENVESTGTYTVKDDKLILKIGNNTRTCKVNSYSIDCTSTGGWYYSKEK